MFEASRSFEPKLEFVNLKPCCVLCPSGGTAGNKATANYSVSLTPWPFLSVRIQSFGAYIYSFR